MRRTLAALAALSLLAACKVERTPPQYYQERDPSVVERQEAEDEVRARIGAFREALGRDDRLGAVEALAPLPMARVVGPGAEEAMGLGPQAVDAALAGLSGAEPAVARMPDLAVDVSLREGIGWFATHLERLPTGPEGGEPARLRMSGVFHRERGDWRLAQLHLSRAWEPPAPPAPATTTDSSAPPPSPPTAGASPGDG